MERDCECMNWRDQCRVLPTCTASDVITLAVQVGSACCTNDAEGVNQWKLPDPSTELPEVYFVLAMQSRQWIAVLLPSWLKCWEWANVLVSVCVIVTSMTWPPPTCWGNGFSLYIRTFWSCTDVLVM